MKQYQKTLKPNVMTLLRRNDPFLGLLDDFFTNDWAGGRSVASINQNLPAVNIKEESDHFCVELAAPGLNKEDFQIDLHNRVLTISAERKEEQTQGDEQRKYTRREFHYASFKRAFTLPETVDTENIHANYVSGVLKIQLPKRDEAKQKPVRSIAIQ